MSESSQDSSGASPAPGRKPRASPARLPQLRIGAAIAIASAAGLVAWLALRGGGETPKARSQPPQAVAASPGRIQSLASSLGHPIFWLGPKAGSTYELTRTSSGRIFVRYLPAGVPVGTQKRYLTVATYPFRDAYRAVSRAARANGAVSLPVAGGGLAVLDSTYPQSVHVAYPRLGYQVEVFAPQPAQALRLVAAGQLATLGGSGGTTAQTRATASAATPAGLGALAAKLGHPIYWAGPKPGFTYELTRTSDGRIFVRYLPRGVKLGDPRPNFLTVGTYPYLEAVTALERLAKASGQRAIALPAGGVAVVDARYPKSIHLAYPGQSFEIEVFDPSPAAAHREVTSGRIRALR